MDRYGWKLYGMERGIEVDDEEESFNGIRHTESRYYRSERKVNVSKRMVCYVENVVIVVVVVVVG